MMLCPQCKCQTRHRTKKGVMRYYLCTACDQTFRTREVVINQEEEVVTAYEKIRGYLATRKTPPTITELSKHFLIGRTTVGRALRRLEEEGFAKRILDGADQRWTTTQASRSERPAEPVAVPKDIRPIKKAVQPSAVRTSYPHIRGYED